MKYIRKILDKIVLLLLILLCRETVAQVVIKGTVYDKQVRYGVADVSVMSSSGIGTLTDSLGHYTIRVPESDSIHFSYLGKNTIKFPVSQQPVGQPLDVSLPVMVDVLPSVTVRQPSYHMDSLAFRKDNEKIFNYDPGLMSAPGTGLGIGIGFELLFNAKKIKRLERFKAFLEREERDRYVDHRFSKALVKRITGLTPPALDSFMKEYRPSYDLLMTFETEYEYYKHIKTSGEAFTYYWKRDHPDVVDSSGSETVVPE